MLDIVDPELAREFEGWPGYKFDDGIDVLATIIVLQLKGLGYVVKRITARLEKRALQEPLEEFHIIIENFFGNFVVIFTQRQSWRFRKEIDSSIYFRLYFINSR